MNLREYLLKKHSKEYTEQITKWIGSSRKRFAELFDVFLHDDYKVVIRAAWVISKMAETDAVLVIPYLPVLVKLMNEPNAKVAVKRSVVRILQFVNIPESLHGAVMNACFSFLADPRETIAIRVFSMSVLANLSKLHPDIKQELKAVIEDILEQGSTAGIRARAKKVLSTI